MENEDSRDPVFEPRGKVAVVTGGAGGIGLGMARAFSDAGMSVVIADIDADRVEATAEMLRAGGHDVVGVRADVSVLDEVQALADAFAARTLAHSPQFRDRIDFLFKAAYGREASSLEFRACRDFLQEIGDDLAEDTRDRAREETPEERRRRFRDRRRRAAGGDTNVPTGPDGETLAWSALCQTIFQSSEFRTLD